MSDIKDILDIETSRPDLSKESIMGTDRKFRKAIPPSQKQSKRPEGMAREVFALLYNDNKDAPPLFPTDKGLGYQNAKANLGMKSVRPWKWTPFTNPARKDNAVFHHWRRVCDEGQEYPFAKFNKEVQIPTYNDLEYVTYLANSSWSREETDHLFDLCKRFNLRFIVICDRWDRATFKPRSVEDLKERYYFCVSALNKAKAKASPGAPQEGKPYIFDAEHEKRRKEQLHKLYSRTKEQIEEEQMLQNELRKIEARKKERDRKTQDLQKLITAADNQNESRKIERKLHHRKKIQLRLDPLSNEISNIKFPEVKTSGIMVRSQRMKMPANIGQKKLKAIEEQLSELKIELNPIPTAEICQHFNEIRSDLLLLNELKNALVTCQIEMHSLRHTYEATNPGKTLLIPEKLSGETSDSETYTPPKIKFTDKEFANLNITPVCLVERLNIL